MGASPRNKPVAVAHENPGGYGQNMWVSMLEWEFFNFESFGLLSNYIQILDVKCCALGDKSCL